MKLEDLQTPITQVPGVGIKTERLFKQLNIFTVSQLLSHYPRDYEDRTEKLCIKDFHLGKKVHTIAKVISHEWFGFGRMKTLKIRIQDTTGEAVLLCFNRPFLEKSFPVGSIISVTGNFNYKYGEIQASFFEAKLLQHARENPFLEASPEPENFKEILPIYPLTEGLKNAQVKTIIEAALKSYSLGLENEIPQALIDERGLLSKKEALEKIHNPKTIQDIEKARYTLIYEELFLFQYHLLQAAHARKKNQPFASRTSDSHTTQDRNSKNKTEVLDDDHFAQFLSPKQKILLERIPFSLSSDQKKSILDINEDLEKAYAPNQGKNKNDSPDIINNSFYMARLLQGDVGSGKTLVAFFAALYCADMGYQSAFLAPTELLAKQHAQNASHLLQGIPGINIAFLSGNIKSQGRSLLLQSLASGDITIIIGTHALFSTNVKYHSLGFIIIDEQHRFGVVQRASILDKGRESIQKTPSYLMMSATPIPQSLALSAFGDLDISTIKTMPKGRGTIQTHLTKVGNEWRVYEAVRKEIEKKRQAYFVYPRIEKKEDEDFLESIFSDEDFSEKEKPNLAAQKDFFENPNLKSAQEKKLKSAEEMYDFLSREVYPNYKLALIHSKIDEEEQSAIMHAFKKGEIDILIATTVVEVGVDVPNATSMVIEHAERFGLAALHQLRGRIGRGSADSHCFLIYAEKLSDTAKERLKAMYENLDGFKIAELDLELRGPGEVAGIQQSGNLQLGIADLVRDRKILLEAREDAEKILKTKS